MFFKELELRDFRNYSYLKESFHEKVNIITGNNAQGKTNLVEALYMMSVGKSFRTTKDFEMIKFGKEKAKISVVAEKQDREIKTEISIDKVGKKVKINGVNRKKSDLLDNIYVVVFSPEDLKIIKEEPEKRRRFINREISQIKPIYYENLFRYTKILTQRNSLLKLDQIDVNLLDVWDTELIEYGTKLILERDRFIHKLNKISGQIHKDITECNEEIEIIYESSIKVMETKVDQKEEYQKQLYLKRKQDIFRKNTSIGPHKDDLKILINGVDARHYGSQGQQRTAALSLKLAEIQLLREEVHEDPILILDDVLSELDEKRQKYLINTLYHVQLFLTTTQISDYVKEHLKDNCIFRIENGIIVK